MKNPETKSEWTAMLRLRRYFPEVMTGDREAVAKKLEAILDNRYHGEFCFRIEEMTDQIDVVIAGRKVAVYMP